MCRCQSLCLLAFFILLVFGSGCSKYYLTVKREIVNEKTLASAFVKSPDPRRWNPPTGEELTFEWRLPPEALNEPLELVVFVLYRNYEEQVLRYPVHDRRGIETFSLLNNEYKNSKGFLAYKAEIINGEKKIIKQWRHQLWTHLIKVEGESPFAAKKKR
ncbi:MAG: hypothetical protein AAF443_01380 [Chlamydiota bacterium]